MLRNVKEIHNYVLEAKDGEIGRCKHFLFDDELWTIRYMVADTGKWLPGRKVLISPISLGEPDWNSRLFPLKLTKELIENSPALDSEAPVSRQYESKWFDYYAYPYYWGDTGIWGMEPYPGLLFSQKKEDTEMEPDTAEGDPSLRSATEVRGYKIQATDDEIGHVEDFIFDDETWTIRYMVVDTRNWLPGRKVLVTPAWINSIDWKENKVSVDLTVEAIKNSPEYDPSAPVNREYEVRLYDFYGRPKYWE
ncbi:MAG: PRC-barrel domain-containing protein [Desulfobulbaceae bacterium]|jgi:hypothetical protein|nr:PRC-barrel domain-containing protein [Desulfobulbaceae bacterium]